MAVRTKKKTRPKKAKKAKKLAVKKAARKAGAKKSPAKKTAKKAVAKKSPAKKTTEQHKQGKRKPAKQSVRKAANKRVAKTPTEKTAWTISPEISQSAFTIDTWKKGDLKLEFLKVYRSGWIIVDKLPDLGGYNPDEGINIFEEFEFDEHQLSGGSEETSLLPNELPPEERERLLALSEEALADEGWTLESVTRFKGPLLVENV